MKKKKDANKAMKKKTVITIIVVIAALAILFYYFGYPAFYRVFTGEKTWEPVYPNSKLLSDNDFEKVAADLTTELSDAPAVYSKHIEAFRKAGIRQYEGPDTCLKCHEEMKVKSGDEETSIDTMKDVLDTVHFRLFRDSAGFSTVGYNGAQVNEDGRGIPVGKIDRACGMTGTFTWTGWADLIETRPEHLEGKTELRSVGCGQCHIGGQFGPATELMLPALKVTRDEKASIDCLICHSYSYDMNYKYVMEVEGGKVWNQDRSMKAAMGAGKPDSKMCLRCHQHNLGGDKYENNEAAKALGHKNRRLLHFGAKRGTPFHEDEDVHAALEMSCLECHEPEGHKIPRGRNSTDLVANDLPGKEVSCEKCHDNEPHSSGKYADQLNKHGKYIACETCHIHDLHDDNLVLLDWTEPVFDEEEGLWDPKILLKSGDPKTAILYLWFNGKGTFLANALGNHPDKTDSYDPLMNQMVKFARFADLDLEARGIKDNNFLSVLTPEMKEKRKKAIKNNLKEWMNKGESKIYPFKIFNARMYEDMANQGPFGAMILPFDYKIYNEKGDPLASVRKAMSHPIVKRMYGLIFKIYMMDKFMHYFGVDTWNTTHPFSDSYEGKVEAHWMRQVGTLMINHSIKSEGIGCKECHSPEGRLDFEALGYTKERADLLKDFAQIEDKN